MKAKSRTILEVIKCETVKYARMKYLRRKIQNTVQVNVKHKQRKNRGLALSAGLFLCLKIKMRDSARNYVRTKGLIKIGGFHLPAIPAVRVLKELKAG